jgi:SAM-dependent methyltransferase
MLTKIAQGRRDFLLRYRGNLKGRILEIGAFDNPTFRRELGDEVEYLDFFSREELIEMHRNNPRRNLPAAVAVDHVVKSSDFSTKLTPGFDLIVAHHVIEHLPDLIFWFEQIECLLASGGILFLSVPDRRYTFDFFRPVSLATQMIRAHAERLQRPDVWQLTEAFYYYMAVDLPAIWAGSAPGEFVPRFSLAKAHEMAKEKSTTYTDAHCWVFTWQSFAQCIGDLHSAQSLAFSVAQLETPQPGTNEFRVLLVLRARESRSPPLK